METIHTVGRRKTAVARTYLRNGSGNIIINGKDYKQYFKVDYLIYKVEEPFKVLNLDINQYDIKVNVKGGGIKGQAEAVRHSIARALVSINEEYRSPLKAAGLLKRDPRQVERKKYGRKKARKRFQFSKR